MSSPNLARRKSMIVTPSSGSGPHRRASVTFGSALSPLPTASLLSVPTDSTLQGGGTSPTTRSPRAVHPNRVRTLFLCGASTASAQGAHRLSTSFGGHPSSSSPVCIEGTGPHTVTVTNKTKRERFDVEAAVLETSFNVPNTQKQPIVRDLAREFVDGNNISLVTVSTPQSGGSFLSGGLFERADSLLTSSSLGNTSQQDVSISGSTHTMPTLGGTGASLTIASAVLGEVFRLLDNNSTLAADGLPFSFEVLLAVSALHDGRVRDLMPTSAASQSDPPVSGVPYQKLSLVAHPITGPKYVGLRYRPVKSQAEFQSLIQTCLSYSLTKAEQHSSKAPNAVAAAKIPVLCVSLILKQCMEEKAVAPQHPAPPATVIMSNFLCLEASEKCSSFIKACDCLASSSPTASPNDLVTLLAWATSGNCHTAAVAAVSEHDDTSSIVAALTCVTQKLGTLMCQGRRRGIVAEFAKELKDQVLSLKCRLDTPGLEGVARRRIEKEVTAKEGPLKELEDLLQNASGHASLSNQLQKMTQLQRLNEAEARKTLDQLTMEKRKRFALAFRSAFERHKQNMVSEERCNELIQDAQDKQNKLVAIQKEMDSLVEEKRLHRLARERAEAELAAERNSRTDADLEVMRLRRVCGDLEVQVLELENRLLTAQSSQTTRLAKLTQTLATAQEELVRAQGELASASSNLAVVTCERDDLRAEMESAALALRKNSNRQLIKAELECSVLREKLSFRDSEIREWEGRHQRTQESFLQMQQRFMDEVRKNEVLKRQIETKVSDLKQKYSIERDAYLELIHEGKCYLDELHLIRKMKLKEKPSMYRGDKNSVIQWLGAVGGGLEALAPTFFHHGFDTTHSVSLMTEEDLIQMHVTAGSRRKLLVAVKELAARYELVGKETLCLFRYADRGGTEARSALTNTTVCSGGTNVNEHSESFWSNADINDHLASPATVESLVDDLRSWLDDFSAAIRAESEMSVTFS